ncbi:myotubularin-related [Anaeramoeba flamelloides]|uniref:phosphatidylinositol-3,5-bisphosphate 3-phosphatase n=1 Tax=Anaeramoeba flamelloides TaxID=1746091 RepID=A0AAV7ZA65_9EUKA|nr:myotubularin-related [Anaeramoeba flamelloides]
MEFSSESDFDSSSSNSDEEAQKVILETLQKLNRSDELSSEIDEDEFDAQLDGIQSITSFKKKVLILTKQNKNKKENTQENEKKQEQKENVNKENEKKQENEKRQEQKENSNTEKEKEKEKETKKEIKNLERKDSQIGDWVVVKNEKTRKPTIVLHSKSNNNKYLKGTTQCLTYGKLKIVFLEGEKIEMKSLNVTFGYKLPQNKIKPILGKLYLTNYRLFFVPNEIEIFDNYDTVLNPEITLGTILRIEKFGHQSTGRGNFSYGIEIYSKDFRFYKFYFLKKNHSRRDIYRSLHVKAFPPTIELSFSYLHKTNKQVVDSGWSIYDPEGEFKRQGLPNRNWSLSKINSKHQICSTYPRLLVFPKMLTNKEIIIVSRYRSKGRLPTLTWIHPKTGATITRCSQPRVGITQRSCEEDQKMLNSIFRSNPEGTKLFIMDCRPKKNAMANRAKGAGYEMIVDYPNCDLTFLGIDNIHVMRESLNRIRNLCFQSLVDDKKWLSGLENTGWFSHMEKIIRSSVTIAKLIENDSQSVLVHCSDGWDRTAQICGLSQLFLDPYFRTIEGFEVLIEKDWLSFGHKFHQRIGQANSDYGNSQRSPVFLQWIDCVYQCIIQDPTAYEFNEDFLIFILENLFSLRFGTFLFNNIQERQKRKLSKYTYSLWTYVNQNTKEFTNKNYRKRLTPIYPEYAIRNFIFWDNYYNKHLIPHELKKKNSIRQLDQDFFEIELETYERLRNEEYELIRERERLERELDRYEKRKKQLKKKISLNKAKKNSKK